MRQKEVCKEILVEMALQIAGICIFSVEIIAK
jgi:hypothetical protein